MKTARNPAVFALLCLFVCPNCTCLQPTDQETEDDGAQESSEATPDPDPAAVPGDGDGDPAPKPKPSV